MKGRYLLVVGLLALSIIPAIAGDIVSMPTGNMVKPHNVELNYIYWSLPKTHGAGLSHVGEVFVGVCDRLELDVDYVHMTNGFPNHVDPTGKPTSFKKDVAEVNAYFRVFDETADHPSLIVGATNLTASTFLPSSQRPTGDSRVSPFAIGAYNIHLPKAGPPTWSDPVVRLHLAYGTGYHEKQFFGGAQVLFTPQIGAAWFNYTGQNAVVGVYNLNNKLQARVGRFYRGTFGSLGYATAF
jgi:hypothetical protein